MEDRFVRTQALIGEDGLNRLKNAKAVLFGVGGEAELLLGAA
jgi:tRNA A37 threonylcarbamoyladenosine dehydratase